MCTARLHQCPFCIDTHAELTRIAGHGEIDPDDPGSARPQLRAVRRFLELTSLTPDRSNAAEATADLADVPEHALQDALRVNLVWNIVNRLANAFGFTLREGQLHSGTCALHCFGYRFPSFLLSDGPTAGHGDAVADLRRSVLEAPATTDPALRAAAMAGEPLPEPWQSYARTVRAASYRITEADMDRLIDDGCSEDQIFEVTVAAAVGAALHSFDTGRNALARMTAG
ncbi:carboxymuconolactone decarboxylase family protein [Streptomyces sp. NPDC059489]|uniref:hypothetical protein n=1 Tax=Streptomyces sp. NPDC059489 TaxID=3346849 RepID=UPI0036A75D6B